MHIFLFESVDCYYASPSSGDAYSDRQLTLNFELNFLCADMFPCEIPKSFLSVCPYPEKRCHPSFVNISPSLVIGTSIERSSRVLQLGNKILDFLFKKGLNGILNCAEITLASSISVLQ